MTRTRETRHDARGTLPWIAFDFLNSLIIVNGSVYFSAWLAGPGGVDARWYGAAYVISSTVLLVGLPVVGSVIDRKRCGRQLLLVTSLGMVACSVAIVFVGHWDDGALRNLVALVLFGSMNVIYHASLVAYDWLLVYLRGVRTVGHVRRTSGYGQGAGMAGSVVGCALGIGLIAGLSALGSHDPTIDMFLVLGLLFLVAGGVDYVLLRRQIDESRAPVTRPRHHRVWQGWVRLLGTHPSLRRFFVAFLLANGVLTVEFYLAIYMQNILGYGPQRIGVAFIVALVAATGGGLLYARVGARHDTRRVLLGMLAVMAPAISALGWVRDDVGFLALLVVIGVVYGILWSASRAHLIELTPRANLGRALAFFAVFERSASVLGPLVWTAILLMPGDEATRFSVAITAMGVMVLGGALVMLRDIRAVGASRGTTSGRASTSRPAAATTR